jgi:hypothetical protein
MIFALAARGPIPFLIVAEGVTIECSSIFCDILREKRKKASKTTTLTEDRMNTFREK